MKRKAYSNLGVKIMLVTVGLATYGTYSYFTSSSFEDSLILHGRDLSSDKDDDAYATGGCKHADQESICIGYGDDACKKLQGAEAAWLIAVVMGLLYLFVGIAIVCDELFVPALEIVAEDLELSNDVAGATLMAAGGSAPELATSFVGTFKRSDVGFGTIVGSAVFNVLFVIGMCVMFTPEQYAPLQLTWWPLFRDCTYYVLTLTTLAVFMVDGKIELWESIVQFVMYFGYVAMMSKSEALEKFITKSYNKYLTKEGSVSPVKAEMLDDTIESGKPDPSVTVDKPIEKDNGANFVRPSTFRVGILQLLTSKNSITETAGIAFVSKIKGDVNVVFERIDKNKNGEIDKEELRLCLLELGTPEEELTSDKIDECMAEIDKNSNGFATKADFTVWYTRNEQRLRNKTREIFDQYDADKKGTITKKDMSDFMLALGHGSKEATDEILVAMDRIEKDFMTYDEFVEWYESSMFWEQEKASAEQAADAQESLFQSIISGFGEFGEMPTRARATFIITLPLSLLLCLIPDCRPPGREKLAPLTLFGSVIMIALFAIVMVELAEIFGETLGIPAVVMGLTILAAGTSVPDLLSSVIVAQQGEGDMAVSSSIGSNIFDVAFGLPLPWLCFNIVKEVYDCNCTVTVSGDPQSLMISLVTLLVMVAAIVVTINYYDWKMTKELGYAMFGMYFAYVIFALSITPASEYESPSCTKFDPF